MLLTCLIWAALPLGLAQMTEEEAIQLAARTLAEELHVDEQALEVVRAVPVSWPDSSLGCPAAGLSYLQVIVPGYRVDLESGGRVHRVHVGDGRAVYCSRPRKTLRIREGQAEAELNAPSRLPRMAREDLASRLDVDVDDIRVEFVEAVTWHDTSLGCPETGRVYEQVRTEGSIIGLEHRGTTYEYHADRKRAVLCEGQYSR